MAENRILLSGATGFIGKELCARLLTAGYHLSALRRNTRPDHSSAISWLDSGDISTTPIAPSAGHNVDVFIHLAATLRPTSSDPCGLDSQNAAIASNLSRFVAEAGIPRVIVLSSIAASVAARSPEHARRYGLEKLAADRIFTEKLGHRCKLIILRPPAVYGPNMRNSIAALTRMVEKGLPIPLGLATQTRHYISVRNLCDLIMKIVMADENQWAAAAGKIFEPSDNQGIATRDLVQMIAHAKGRRARLIPAPLILLRAMGSMTGRSELISGAIDGLDVAPVVELEAAFGWRPVEQMPESLAFMRDEIRPF